MAPILFQTRCSGTAGTSSTRTQRTVASAQLRLRSRLKCAYTTCCIAMVVRPTTDSELETIVAIDKVMAKEMNSTKYPKSNTSKLEDTAQVEPFSLAWLQQRIGSTRNAFANWHAITGVVPAKSAFKSAHDDGRASSGVEARKCNDSGSNAAGLGSTNSAISSENVSAGFVISSHEVNRSRFRKQSSKYLEIFWIAVKVEWRGRGLGEALLLEAIRRARLVDPALKEVRRYNNVKTVDRF